MAVSQVDGLKTPCRVWRRGSLVAAQPPVGAPATPMTQVMARPCDLLPGISILASRPAAGPRPAHPMMPITASLVRDKSGMRSRPVLPGSPRQESFSRSIPVILWPDRSGPGGPEWSVLDGVLDLGAGLLHVALEPVTAARGAQATAAGEPAGGPFEAAFDRFGLVRELLAGTHRGLPLVGSFGGRGGTGRDVGRWRCGRDAGGWLASLRLCGRGGGLPRGGTPPEQARPIAAAVVLAGVKASRRRAVAQGAGGVGAGGVALADEVVAVLADRGGLLAGLGGLALGLPKPAPRRAAAAGGVPYAGQQQPQPEQGHRPHRDSVQEHRARAGHVVAEHREPVREPVRAAVTENPGHADDDRGDQDDEPKNNDHGALRGFTL